ncbi:MAG: penicillin-binding protein 2 [Patescibacteria group bacterium]|nr:penicillin-binding protein 2 [Patescibacteria group bacterium]
MNGRLRLLLIFFYTLFFIIIGKLFYLQIINQNVFWQNNYLQVKKILPERGKIYDRFGLPLVINKTAYLLYLEPKKIIDEKELVEKIDKVLNLGTATIEAKIDKKKDWISLKDNLDKNKKQEIESLKIKGVGFEEHLARDYPESSLAAHLLGFVGKNYQGEDVGYFGIEGFYDKDLRGIAGVLKTERDPQGQPIFIGTQEKINAEDGRDLYLTIDKSIQTMVKKKLTEGIDRYKAKQGCVIVTDPSTLEILALVCLPDFDPENYFLSSEELFKNPAISNLYEPGSIFKPLIMAAALEEKAVKATDFYNEDGPVKVGEYAIKTWNNKYEGKISMTRILEKSSNVGMVYVGERLGQKKIYSYLKKFGFGELTEIDLQGEISGYLKSLTEWYPINYATVTFGQGLAVTPIQMIRAFSSIINGGYLLKPYVVKKIVSFDGREVKIEKKIIRRVISEQTSTIIKKMLYSTVENGEIKWAKPKGYQIGGKTGTAQIPIKGYYDPTKTVASFIGFAPVDKPRFIVLVSLFQLETSPWGSETAAPLFFEIAKELLIYYNIAPEQ